MKIVFHLAWHKPGKALKAAFKHPPYLDLIDTFVQRLEHFSSCEITSLMQGEIREAGTVHWFCHPEYPKGQVSSESLAKKVKELEVRGTKTLRIHIGGPDGFASANLTKNADFIWSFGPLTLPHELACLVAVEQVYRAFTINKGLPYHLGH